MSPDSDHALAEAPPSLPAAAQLPQFTPLAPFADEALWLSAVAQRRWLLGLLLLGLALRVGRYLLRFPLWEDEAMLSANLLDRNFAELLQPLHYCQVAPTLFLWCQLTVVRLLGFHEYSLRLVPFLCSLFSLALFRHVAGRMVQGVALMVAVGIFAVAYPMSRYAAEAKPYGCDLFIALALLTLAIEWMRRPDQTRWLWCLAALVGPAIGFSYSAIFAAGGTSLAIGAMLLRTAIASRRSVVSTPGQHIPERRDASFFTLLPSLLPSLLPWLAMNVAILASFAVVLHVSRQAVGEMNQQTMEEVHWADTFPPVKQPLALLAWLLKSHCGAMLGYPLGGPNWGSTASALAFLGGALILVRRRPWLAFLLLCPLALNFVAAALHKYPYGGHARMTLYIAPAICTLMGLGLTAALARLPSNASRYVAMAFNPARLNRLITSRRSVMSAGEGPLQNARYYSRIGLGIVLLLLSAMGAGSLLRDVTHPFKSGTTLRAREFAQWFWFTQAYSSELVSCEIDMKTDMSPEKRNCGWSCLYLCNQQIYSPRLARGDAPHWEAISLERPLCCVMYRSPKEERESPPPDAKAYAHWLDRMQAQYDLVGHETMAFAALDKADRQPISDDYIELFKFVPRGMAAAQESMPSSVPSAEKRIALKPSRR